MCDGPVHCVEKPLGAPGSGEQRDGTAGPHRTRLYKATLPRLGDVAHLPNPQKHTRRRPTWGKKHAVFRRLQNSNQNVKHSTLTFLENRRKSFVFLLKPSHGFTE